MILGAQIGLLIYGMIAIIRGSYSLGKGRKIIGTDARRLGAVCLAPIPLSALAGFGIGFLNPEAVSSGELRGMIAGVEVAILICTIVALIALSKKYHNQQQETMDSDLS